MVYVGFAAFPSQHSLTKKHFDKNITIKKQLKYTIKNSKLTF